MRGLDKLELIDRGSSQHQCQHQHGNSRYTDASSIATSIKCIDYIIEQLDYDECGDSNTRVLFSIVEQD